MQQNSFSSVHLNGNYPSSFGMNKGSSSNNAKRRNRRQRFPPSHYHSSTAAEERFLQQAIQNSKLDQGRPADGRLDIPSGPVFYPTIADFEGNPLHYIEKIRPVAEKYGICKIVPPAGWNPGSQFGVNLNSTKRFQTKQQLLHRLQEGISFGDGVEYTPAEYLRMASQRTTAWKSSRYPDHDLLSRHSEALQKMQQSSSNASDGVTKSMPSSIDSKLFTADNLERDYWDIVEKSKEFVVEYGNDVDSQEHGSGFPLSERGRAISGTINPDKVNLPEPKFGDKDYYKETWWNLNNIPCAPESVLRHVRVAITGINIPWMYYGMMFTTFCWHNEDNNLYSINYNHKGAPKLWYGIPGSKECADGLEKVFKGYLSMKMREVPDLLHHITTMFSPRLLQNADLKVSKIVQYEGEFIVTFPRAFHSGLSLGPNIGEAVNFATSDWISYGADANERYRSLGRPSVFSHDRLCFTMANHLKDQKSQSSCKLLLKEVERIVDEELMLRDKLRADGVRDVSKFIRVPNNRLDQLDEASASYDDKRLCHACKHVCFFAAVACECSQSKVSCLRHSHFMCRCPAKRKYFMFWSSNDEMSSTVERVKIYCQGINGNSLVEKGTAAQHVTSFATPISLSAPGVSQDYLLHKSYDLPTNAITSRSFESLTFASKELLELNENKNSERPSVVGDKRSHSLAF